MSIPFPHHTVPTHMTSMNVAHIKDYIYVTVEMIKYTNMPIKKYLRQILYIVNALNGLNIL